MKKTIRQLYEKIDVKEVKLSGWIRSNRDQKEFGFLMLNDGTYLESVQVVYELSLNNFKEIQKIRTGAAVYVFGEIILTPNAKQPFEIKAKEIILLGDSTEDFPIQPKRHTKEFLREVAHLRMRTNLFSAVFRVRSIAAMGIHTFFQNRNFVYVNTPIITANDGEGAGEMFLVTAFDANKMPLENKEVDFKKDFFGKKVSLTVTGQLEAEAFALAFRDVYTFGPTFRAENSNTQKHAAEFWMIEPEIAFADLEDDMALIEDMIIYVVNYVLDKAKPEMTFFNEFVDKGLLEKLNNVMTSRFNRITHYEAITILKESKVNFENKPEYTNDLATEHEKYLTENYFKGPVFVTNWPKEIKAFYMRINDDGKTVAAVDLLVPGSGELVGGSQREERLDLLEARMKEMNVPINGLEWYMDLRKYGGCKHAGFGLGFERLIMYLTGMENIRDVIPFSRTPRNCEF